MASLDKQELKHDPVAESIVEIAQEVKTKWRLLAIVGAVALFIVLVIAWRANARMRYPEEASFALFSARSPEAMEQVAQNYRDTAAGAVALSTLAVIAAHQTNYERAISLNKRLVTEYPQSFLFYPAQLAIAKSYMALGSLETEPARRQEMFRKAEEVLRNDLLYNPNHYAGVSAQMDLVRVLYAQGRYADAWNELRRWDQQMQGTYLASMADGLREKLARETGIVTNAQPQVANEQPTK